LYLKLAMTHRDKNGSFTSSRDSSEQILPQQLYPVDDVLRYAPLPNELVDRQRLMQHISLLTAHVQRLQLQLRASSIHVPEEVQRSFDPVISELQIRRLDDLLAQQSLLREAERGRISRLEAEVARLQQERTAMLDHIAAMEKRVENDDALRREIGRRDEKLRNAEAEVDHLRRVEQRMAQQLQRYTQLSEDQPYTVRVQRRRDDEEPAGRGWRRNDNDEKVALEVGEEEALARQALMAEALFEPLAVALEAGIIWHSEMERMRGKRAEDDSQSEATKSTNAQQLMHEALVARGDYEVQRQKVIFVNMQLERTERLLTAERQRCEQLAEAHNRELEMLTAQVAKERQHILDRLVPDVEQQLRHAYREGRIFERNRRRERRRKPAAEQTSEPIPVEPNSQPSTVPSEGGSKSDDLL
jgi:hypothetical protein